MSAIAINYGSANPMTPSRDLADAESKLAREESELTTQIARAGTLVSGIAERAATIQERARRLAEQYPETSGSGGRVHVLQMPKLDVSREAAELERIRNEALTARTQVHTSMRAALERYAQQLDQLTTGLDADARALERAATDARNREAEKKVAAAVTVAAAPPPVPAHTTETGPQQRRSHKRTPLKAVIDYKSESTFYRGFSVDVGEGGVFIATFELLPKDALIELVLTLPDEREVKATGQVRWTREWNDLTPELFPGMGIQFLNVEDDGTDSIRRFVDVREPLFYTE